MLLIDDILYNHILHFKTFYWGKKTFLENLLLEVQIFFVLVVVLWCVLVLLGSSSGNNSSA